MMQDFADDFYERTCYTGTMVIYGTASAGKSLQGLFLWRNYGIQEDQLYRAGLVHPQV